MGMHFSYNNISFTANFRLIEFEVFVLALVMFLNNSIESRNILIFSIITFVYMLGLGVTAGNAGVINVLRHFANMGAIIYHLELFYA